MVKKRVICNIEKPDLTQLARAGGYKITDIHRRGAPGGMISKVLKWRESPERKYHA